MKRLFGLCLSFLLLAGMLAGCADNGSTLGGESTPPEQTSQSSQGTPDLEETPSGEDDPDPEGAPVVYMTTDISAESLVEIYEALEPSSSGHCRKTVHRRARKQLSPHGFDRGSGPVL